MAYDWPVGLPCAPLVGSMRRRPANRKDAFTPSLGERDAFGVRFTGTTWITSCTLVLTRTVQLPIWEEFYEVTLMNGARRFNMNNVLTLNQAMVCQFPPGDPPEPYDSGNWANWYLPLLFKSWKA